MATKAKSKKTTKKKEAAKEFPTLKGRENYLKAVGLFEEAFGALGKKDFAKAAEGFQALLEQYPDQQELHDRAAVYLRKCEQKLADPPAEPETLDALYLHGVYQTNAGEFDAAIATFDRALAMEPGSEKVLYASAVTLAQLNRKADAMKRLRAAIEANPLNRIQALNDADFESVRDEPEFIDMVEPEESRSGQESGL